MPVARLSSVVDMTIYEDIPSEDSPELLAFIDSGILVQDEEFDAKAKADGELGYLDFWRDLDHDEEENYSDDSDDRAVPSSTKQSRAQFVKNHINKGYGAKDLTREIQKGEDAMTFIKRKFDRYWSIRKKKRIVSAVIGIYNANVAGNFHPDMIVPGVAGDMIVDVTGTANPQFSRAAFVQANFTLGDQFDLLTVILVHSFIYQVMVNNDDIDFIPDSSGTFMIPYFMGKRVIIDDGSPTVDVAGTTHFISVLLGGAMFGFGEGDPQVPMEMWRDPQTGQGGGEEQIWERKTWLVHPLGHTNLNAIATKTAGTNGTKAAQQSNVDLQNANNWQRTHSRKNVPIAFLKTLA